MAAAPAYFSVCASMDAEEAARGPFSLRVDDSKMSVDGNTESRASTSLAVDYPVDSTQREEAAHATGSNGAVAGQEGEEPALFHKGGDAILGAGAADRPSVRKDVEGSGKRSSGHAVKATMTPATAQLSIFNENLEDRCLPLRADAEISRGIVMSKEIQEHLYKLRHGRVGAAAAERRKTRSKDECSICLSELGCHAECVTLACRHTFHAFCIVETLGTGSCKSCPLCRTVVAKLVPGFVDGHLLKLVARLRMSADSAMWAHRTILTSIQSGIIDCQERLSQLRRSKPLPWRSKARLEKAQMLRNVARQYLARLKLLEDLSKLNADFLKLVFSCMGRDISRDLTCKVREAYLLKTEHYRDCTGDKGGNGITMVMTIELEKILKNIDDMHLCEADPHSLSSPGRGPSSKKERQS